MPYYFGLGLYWMTQIIETELLNTIIEKLWTTLYPTLFKPNEPTTVNFNDQPIF